MMMKILILDKDGTATKNLDKVGPYLSTHY